MMWFREVQRPCAEALWGRAMASLPDPEVAFGPRWRERPRPGERTWAVVDDRGKLLGVGSLESAGPGAVSYCVCLLPEARGCGARLRVREYLVDEAFRDARVQEVRAAVLLSNTRHLDQRVRELAAGPWAWGGVSGDPPEAAFTVSREAWEARW
ncbi:MAG TPA: hypothetical protein DCQ64_29705 [Candidatus Rokubacteria bacterium]|nr:hypothetical protein [Candidatus Rokubacteria bacterium]